MNIWYQRLRFLWEEPPLGREALATDREEPSGVPRLLRRATHYALMGVVSTTLMAQIIGVRLVAPADAQPNHCVQECQTQFQTCRTGCASLPPSERGTCVSDCAHDLNTCKTGCTP